MTSKQAKFIKNLHGARDVSTFPDHLKQGLDAAVFGQESGHAMYVTGSLATQIIDALKSMPKKAKGKDPNAPKIKKTTTDWDRADLQEIIRQVAHGEISEGQAATQIGVSQNVVHYRTKWYRRFGTASTPEHVKARPSYSKKSTAGKTVIVPSEFQGITQHQIDWAGFFGLEQMERFDLKVVCSMFYAAERFVTAKKSAPELYDQKQQAARYIDTWAGRFAKYTLAACAGEFRHRRRKGLLHFIVQGGVRSACQGTAEGLWDKGKEVTKNAVAVMEQEFTIPGNFKSAYGGPKWAKIAKTLRLFLEGSIPAVVFADYVWDLSHNAGRFFDKCPLFQNEREVRTLLGRKKASTSLDIIPWAGAYLHPKWKENLDLLEAVNFEGGEA